MTSQRESAAAQAVASARAVQARMTGRQHVRGVRERVLRVRRDTVARDTVWATGLEGFQLAVMLLSFTLLGKQLGPAGFGAYAAMYALIGILGGFIYSGVTLSVVQHLVRDKQDLSRVLSSCLGLVLTAGLAGALVGVLVGTLTVPSVPVLVLCSFMLAELIGTASIEILASVVYAREGVAVAARYRLVPLVAKLLVLLGLYFSSELTIPALGLAYLAMYPGLAVAVAWSVGRRYGVLAVPGRPRLAHVRSSGLYSTTIAALSLQNDADKVVMTASKIGAEAGLYAAAYRLVLMGMVPLRALLAASHRRFLEHDPEMRNQHTRRSLRFSIMGAAYGLLFGVALYAAAPMVTVLLGDQYDGAVTMLRVLAPVVAVRSFAEFGLNGLLGFGRVGVRTVATLCAAATALILYVLLIPGMGWRGAVVGTYVSEALLALIAWSALIYYQRRHNSALGAATVDGQHEVGSPAARAVDRDHVVPSNEGQAV